MSKNRLTIDLDDSLKAQLSEKIASDPVMQRRIAKHQDAGGRKQDADIHQFIAYSIAQYLEGGAISPGNQKNRFVNIERDVQALFDANIAAMENAQPERTRGLSKTTLTNKKHNARSVQQYFVENQDKIDAHHRDVLGIAPDPDKGEKTIQDAVTRYNREMGKAERELHQATIE